MKASVAILIVAAALLSFAPTIASAGHDDNPYNWAGYVGHGHWGGYRPAGHVRPYDDPMYLGNGHWGGYRPSGHVNPYDDPMYLGNGHWGGLRRPYESTYLGNGHWGGLIHPAGSGRSVAR